MNEIVKRYVQKSLQHIDADKPAIVLGLPATSFHDFRNKSYAHTLKRTFQNTASVSIVDYPATWRLRDSVSIGCEILSEVINTLDHPGIHLIGESQGGWVIGNVLSEPDMYNKITRSVLLGHPFVCDRHWDNDEKVWEINHPSDPFTHAPKGDQELLLNMFIELMSKPLHPMTLRELIKHQNIDNALLLTKLGIIGGLEIGVLPNRLLLNTHNYTPYVKYAAEYLYSGQKMILPHSLPRFGFLRSS